MDRRGQATMVAEQYLVKANAPWVIDLLYIALEK